MSTRKFGTRYLLLMYYRAWGRLWKSTLFLGILLGILWWQADPGKSPILQAGNSIWVLVGAVFTLGIGTFAFSARKMSYIQPRSSYLLLVTPFLRLKISYRRIKRVYPVDMLQLFPPSRQSWTQQRFLAPFYGKTAVALALKGYPLSPFLLRFFLPPQFFLPKATGFVLMVEDWMGLSAAVDTSVGTWQDQRRRKF